MKIGYYAIGAIVYLTISAVAWGQNTQAPRPTGTPNIPRRSQTYATYAKDECHNLLGRGPEAEFRSQLPNATPFPRPTPLPEVHLVRAGKVVVFNSDNSVTVIREDGATTIGSTNKCEKSDMNFGKYTAEKFVQFVKYVKSESRLPADVKASLNKWLVRYFDACSKTYPDVEALRPMLADIQAAATAGNSQDVPRTTR